VQRQNKTSTPKQWQKRKEIRVWSKIKDFKQIHKNIVKESELMWTRIPIEIQKWTTQVMEAG